MYDFKKFALLYFIIFSTSCSGSSDSQASQYRQSALDISGSYVATPDSDLNMDFVIKNEDNKKYNIHITLNRKTPLTEEEKALLNQNGFNPQTTEERFTEPFILGPGFESDLKTGENYSKDGGTTSQFFVCSAEPDTLPDSNSGLLEARYCISGQFDGKSHEISGKLILNVVYNSLQQEADGSWKAEDKGKFQITYKAKAIKN